MFSYHGECAGHNPSEEWGGPALFTEKLLCLRCIQRFWVHVDLYFHLLCSHKHQNHRRSLGLKLVIIWPVNLQGMLLSSKCSFFAQKCDKSSQHRVVFKALNTWPLFWGLQTCQQDHVGGRILVSSFQNKAVNTDVSVRCCEISKPVCGICCFHLFPQALTTRSFGYFSESLGLCDSSGGFEGAS